MNIDLDALEKESQFDLDNADHWNSPTVAEKARQILALIARLRKAEKALAKEHLTRGETFDQALDEEMAREWSE